jgi:hypothetical protein
MARPDARDGPLGRLAPPGDRSTRTQPAKAEVMPSVPPGAVRRLLALSDERDLWLRRVLDAWREGRESVNGSYPDGYDFGFDHGYGARQDARAFVRGIIDGYGEGLAERHRMLEEIRGRDRVKHLARRAAAQ